MPQAITPQAASAPVTGEVSISVDRSMHDFQFTRNWFRNRNQLTWSTFLKPKFRGVYTDWPVKMIQIGVFEGMDLVWCLQNILTHEDSQVLAIDPWAATTKLDQEYMAAVEARARHNLAPWANKVSIMKGFSQDILAMDGILDEIGADPADLIVIDGDHNADPVFRDAELALACSHPGTWLVFDDVRNQHAKADHVYHGIEKFLAVYGDRVKLEFRHRFVDCYSVL